MARNPALKKILMPAIKEVNSKNICGFILS